MAAIFENYFFEKASLNLKLLFHFLVIGLAKPTAAVTSVTNKGDKLN